MALHDLTNCNLLFPLMKHKVCARSVTKWRKVVLRHRWPWKVQ